MATRLETFLEESFLHDLLFEEGVTDVSYNGEAFYYETRVTGRKKADLDVSDKDVGDFLRQIANYAEKQFSYMNPILDVSFGRYRLSAVFPSVARVRDKKSHSFSLRLAYEGSVLTEDDAFFGKKGKKILLDALKRHESIVIGGETGAGKTELQKYLILQLPEATRVIVIDNVEELELTRKAGLDLTSWLVDERIKEASFPNLIRTALRNNPDYLLIAESRGGEMLDALNCAMAGHPIITTIHARDIFAMPYRMGRMAMMGGERLLFEDVMGDIRHHFRYFVYVKKEFSKSGVKRYIDQIGKMDESKGELTILYSHKEAA